MTKEMLELKLSVEISSDKSGNEKLKCILAHVDSYSAASNGANLHVIGSTSMTAEKAESELPQVTNPNQWISVKEKLPSDGEPVLLWYSGFINGDSAVAFYDDGNWKLFYTGTDNEPITNPDFWMPLPHPPKPKDE